MEQELSLSLSEESNLLVISKSNLLDSMPIGLTSEDHINININMERLKRAIDLLEKCELTEENYILIEQFAVNMLLYGTEFRRLD
jgi:7,8-dihydro-6-hydroxymethylpterin-pyrophosphokinase